MKPQLVRTRGAWYFRLLTLAVGALISCSISRASTVRIDAVSTSSPSNVFSPEPSNKGKPTLKNIRVSDSERTYQLVCNIESEACETPILGATYQLVSMRSTKPEELGDFEGEFPQSGELIELISNNVRLGPYWLVVELPNPTSPFLADLANGYFEHEFATCTKNEEGLNEDDCMRWLARRGLLRHVCSGAFVETACRSLTELLDATDPDLLDLLARMEHVYVCFRPGSDTFFTLWFTEPDPHGWREENDQERKLWPAAPGTLVTFGFPGVYYYSRGLQEKDTHMQGEGVWQFLPLGRDTSPASMARIASSKDAKYFSKVFQIDGTGVYASERYTNVKHQEVEHVLEVQRSIGRFSESYKFATQNQLIEDFSGKCVVVPNANGDE